MPQAAPLPGPDRATTSFKVLGVHGIAWAGSEGQVQSSTLIAEPGRGGNHGVGWGEVGKALGSEEASAASLAACRGCATVAAIMQKEAPRDDLLEHEMRVR